MNIIHELRSSDTTEPLLYPSKDKAYRAAEKALERSNNRLDEIIVRIDELEHKIYSWNFGNITETSAPKSPITIQETPVIQEQEMTIVQKAVFAVLLVWSISVTVHLCFQDKSFTSGFFWKYCFSALLGFLLVQLYLLTANRLANMMAVKAERDAARSRLREIRNLLTGEESLGYRDNGFKNSPVVREIESLTKGV